MNEIVRGYIAGLKNQATYAVQSIGTMFVVIVISIFMFYFAPNASIQKAFGFIIALGVLMLGLRLISLLDCGMSYFSIRRCTKRFPKLFSLSKQN